MEPKWMRNQYSDEPVFFFKPDQAYGYLCQWYLVDMMYHKAKAFGDTEMMAEILKEKAPAKQKALGKGVRGFTDHEWDKIKYNVVVRANTLKFNQCKARPYDRFAYPPEGFNEGDKIVFLRDLLLATGKRELAEAARFDKVWGIGFNIGEAPKSQKTWGQNLLGKALMEVREQVRKAEERN